jgi:hypothetical protein
MSTYNAESDFYDQGTPFWLVNRSGEDQGAFATANNVRAKESGS